MELPPGLIKVFTETGEKLTNAFIGQPESLAMRFGKTGEATEFLIKDAWDVGKAKGTIASKQYRDHIKNLSESEWDNVALHTDGQVFSKKPKELKSAIGVRQVLNDFWKEVDKSGIPSETGVKFRDNFFPHSFYPEDIEKYNIGGQKREDMILGIMDKFKVGRNEATDFLNKKAAKHARYRSFGPVDFKREFNLSGYRMDRNVIEEYLMKGYPRTEMAKRLGPLNEQLERFSKDLPPEQRQLYLEMSNNIVGPPVSPNAITKEYGKFSTWASNKLVMAYMLNSAFHAIEQGFLGPSLRFEMRDVFKGIGHTLYQTSEDKEFLDVMKGSIGTLDQSFGQYVKDGGFLDKTRFTDSVLWDRAVTAIVAKYALPRMAKLAASGDKFYLRQLASLGIAPVKFLQRGLTNEDVVIAATRVIRETQTHVFRPSMPLYAQRGSPLSVFYHLGSFRLIWGNAVFKHAIMDEAIKHKNFYPLMRLLGLGIMGGMAKRTFYNTLTGREFKDPGDMVNPIDNLLMSGVLGVLGDFFEGGRAGRALNSPIFSLIDEGYNAEKELRKGNVVPSIRYIGKRFVLPAAVEALPKSLSLPVSLAGQMALGRGLQGGKGGKHTKRT